MEQINELVKLAQQLDAEIDDSGMVLTLNIDANGSVRFLVESSYLLEKFDNVDVFKTGDGKFPFKLETEIEGVIFRAHVHIAKSEHLRGYVPDEWLAELVKKEEGVHKIKICKDNTPATHEKSPIAPTCE